MVVRSPLLLSCYFLWTSSSAFTLEPTRQQLQHLPTTGPLTARFMSSTNIDESPATPKPPLYVKQGLFSAVKPVGWTSQQVVERIRSLLEKDAKARGVQDRRKQRPKIEEEDAKAEGAQNKPKKKARNWMKVGVGGKLDPLASGVLVVGVGKGTKKLQDYFIGSKGYEVGVELGYQTTTLDLDENGEIVDKMPFDHVTWEAVESNVDDFRGTVLMKHPFFSNVLKKDGKQMQELGKQGMATEHIEIEAKEVVFHRLELQKEESEEPRTFGLAVECRSDVFMRTLVRDIGISLDTLATMTSLERTKQGQYLPEHCLIEDDWTAEKIYKAIEETNFDWVEEGDDEK